MDTGKRIFQVNEILKREDVGRGQWHRSPWRQF